MSQTEQLVKRLPNDIGGVPADPIQWIEHELEPWEKRCHALADVLDFHKIINTEEKRRGVEALGAEMVGKLTYYERWIAAFANILFQKGILTPERAGAKDGRGRGPMACRAGRRRRGTSGTTNGPGPPVPETCFFEGDPEPALSRRMVAEGVGTLLLMLAATGGGLTAQRLFPDSPGLGIVASAGATAGALVGLILAFGSVSGGHFNPLITGLQWLSGERRRGCALAYVVAQVGGGSWGPCSRTRWLPAAARPSAHRRRHDTGRQRVPRAAAGLMAVVFGCARGGGRNRPLRCGRVARRCDPGEPSASYANPAVTLGALFAAGPIGLSLSTALVYVPAQVAGALVALLVIAVRRTRNITSEVNRRP